MRRRRLAALLCVLLVHAAVIHGLIGWRPVSRQVSQDAPLLTLPITIFLPIEALADPVADPVATTPPLSVSPPQIPAAAPAPGVSVSPGESAAITPPARVDWPIEGRKSAARVLAAEAEAERIARMFSGPGGTWASLTKRQREKISQFRWKPGVHGLEYDERGNAIYHISEGCVLVNALFFGCKLGKPKVHDDMFDNMREYFDEQRRPQTHEGNGTEPEALRPANR